MRKFPGLRERVSGLAGGGEKDGVAARLGDASGGGKLDFLESGGGKLFREGVAAEPEMEDAVGVAVERTVLGIEVGEGKEAAGGEQGEEFQEERGDVGDVVEGHGGGNEVEGAGGEGILGKVGEERFNIGESGGPGFLSEDAEHSRGGIDGNDAPDARDEGEGQQASPAAVVEDRPIALEGNLALEGGEDVVGELDAPGLFVPRLGAFIEGVGHLDFLA